MHSLRGKFTLTLLLASLSAIVLVGAIAQHLVLARFNQLAMERAFNHFRTDVRGFLTEYGSWRQGEAQEGFTNYVMRDRRAPALTEPAPGPYRDRPLGPYRGQQPGPYRGQQPGPYRGQQPGPYRGQQPGPYRNPLPRPQRGQPPRLRRPGLRHPRRPPFRFVLLAPDGVVIQGSTAHPRGSTLPTSLRARQMPITIAGRVRAYAVPLGSPVLSKLDRSYLAAINKALLYALGSATIVALILGVFFGNRLSQSLRALTSAVAAMHAGNLRQRVDVRTKDEVGTLARNFNAMSNKLAQAYEQLETSHKTIANQAAQLKELSIRDELTGMYNRRYFNEQMQQVLVRAKRYGHPVSIAIADIDDFKKINDGFGHTVGDQVLAAVGRLIQTNIRNADIPARFGGEEFVIAFPETTSEHAAALCERLRRKIEQFHWPDIAQQLTVTISIGLDTTVHPETSDQVLGAADKKLYAAKNGGKNRLVA